MSGMLRGVVAAAVLAGSYANAQQPADPVALLRTGADQTEAIQVTDEIYLAVGFGNTFMVTTDEGNVIVDTSLPAHAPRHKQHLTAANDSPVRYIILTHGHGDHRGGVAQWKTADNEVIAQENYAEFVHYQMRLGGFFNRRNAAQFSGQIPPVRDAGEVENYGGNVDATILFDDVFTFALGGLTFELHHAPGETYDHLAVWIPELKAAFVGDNFYDSFPNIYTLRGTQPRWALDYINSLNLILSWEPELLLPSHGMPLKGWETIRERVTQYRDAIQYVHDATVAGMNEGKDVYALMNEIKLPDALDVGEGYGKISWSVRGIYEGYVGWFDGNPATMYESPPTAAAGELVALAGGSDAAAERARALVDAGETVLALQLADAALQASPQHAGALAARRDALESLLETSQNANETGWLRAALNETMARLKDAEK